MLLWQETLKWLEAGGEHRMKRGVFKEGLCEGTWYSGPVQRRNNTAEESGLLAKRGLTAPQVKGKSSSSSRKSWLLIKFILP